MDGLKLVILSCHMHRPTRVNVCVSLGCAYPIFCIISIKKNLDQRHWPSFYWKQIVTGKTSFTQNKAPDRASTNTPSTKEVLKLDQHPILICCSLFQSLTMRFSGQHNLRKDSCYWNCTPPSFSYSRIWLCKVRAGWYDIHPGILVLYFDFFCYLFSMNTFSTVIIS